MTNGIGSFLMLGGIGLLYGRTGALNFAQLSRALSGHPAGALVILGFTLVMGALFIKGAIIPFHFWIADAHSVAPSPVCVIFSGIMVPIAIFGAARVYWSVFAEAGVPQAVLRPLLVWLGTATAVLGGLAALMQRDVKRLLAFSTVSHMGVLLFGVGLLSAEGLAGGMLYLLGHGLVTGLAYALGGLLLAGLPVGLEHQGRALIDAAADSHGYAYLTPLLSSGLRPSSLAATIFHAHWCGWPILRWAGSLPDSNGFMRRCRRLCPMADGRPRCGGRRARDRVNAPTAE